jgi:hypothetical protein
VRQAANPPPASPPPTPAARQAQEPAVHVLLEQEKVHRLIERLKTPERPAAAAQLLSVGLPAVPSLLAALERRDVELRRQAHEVLQGILRDVVQFDPYAPEALRSQQLMLLRDRLLRKAG